MNVINSRGLCFDFFLIFVKKWINHTFHVDFSYLMEIFDYLKSSNLGGMQRCDLSKCCNFGIISGFSVPTYQSFGWGKSDTMPGFAGFHCICKCVSLELFLSHYTFRSVSVIHGKIFLYSFPLQALFYGLAWAPWVCIVHQKSKNEKTFLSEWPLFCRFLILVPHLESYTSLRKHL